MYIVNKKWQIHVPRELFCCSKFLFEIKINVYFDQSTYTVITPYTIQSLLLFILFSRTDKIYWVTVYSYALEMFCMLHCSSYL